jgi:hypothetical protein
MPYSSMSFLFSVRRPAKGKRVFIEKVAKTFAPGAAPGRCKLRENPEAKDFWFFFSTKNRLP